MSSKTITSGTVTLCLTIEENSYIYANLVMSKKRLEDDIAFFEERQSNPQLLAELKEELLTLNDLIHLVGGN